jgi:hypothetical protein
MNIALRKIFARKPSDETLQGHWDAVFGSINRERRDVREPSWKSLSFYTVAIMHIGTKLCLGLVALDKKRVRKTNGYTILAECTLQALESYQIHGGSCATAAHRHCQRRGQSRPT